MTQKTIELLMAAQPAQPAQSARLAQRAQPGAYRLEHPTSTFKPTPMEDPRVRKESTKWTRSSERPGVSHVSATSETVNQEDMQTRLQEEDAITLDSTKTSGLDMTHVNARGEAHIVDVGSKVPSKRIAIAFCVVQFHSDRSLGLIQDNVNKKGDVKGTARIAGIMAAKRTSELIPLCHPLAITKIEINIEDVQANKSRTRIDGGYGGLVIEALVECTGPTGVEMEALTAVTVTALTIVDMCKAFDPAITIRASQVVYKDGGRSGRRAQQRWVQFKGKDYFDRMSLSPPRLSDESMASKIEAWDV